MVTQKQRREIRERMRAIKDAKDNGESEEIIKKRTRELTSYLRKEGIINPFDE